MKAMATTVAGSRSWSYIQAILVIVEGDISPGAGVGPDPVDRYRGVRALFNADLHAIDPTYAPREDWIILDPLTIEHLRPVGQR
ncbi:hypothetical protein [Microbacterium sp. oral taxon 186]|uniref:hypothetical protein n=1 Tax=Microbacterium sp. oral taxon 186 TaxID=712383 RepID=UPI0012F784E9|nr:hypothetical protein [Microbacterium sp. oral taxon 186]